LDRLGSGSASENGGDGDTRRRCSRNDASHYGGLPAGADHAGIVRRGEDSLLSHIFLRGVKGVILSSGDGSCSSNEPFVG
jgi:hypothetical protein